MEQIWYFSHGGGDRNGPVTEQNIRALVGSGRLKSKDLLWKEGMKDWQPVHTFPQFKLEHDQPSSQVIETNALPAGMLGWMSLVGVITIISGVASLCHMFIGILLIVAGVALMGAKASLENVKEVDPALLPFFQKFTTYIKMTGIFYIISLVLTVMLLLLYFIMVAATASSMGM